ncbi:MAG: hypothetical protein KBT47_00870 [Armatimonadetes bacterium]|nr:hypothetical protein [Candidatus Hippobium faecium]
MDKLNEFLEDKNNKIIVIAILAVIVVGIVVLVGVLMNNNKSGSGSSTASTSGMPGAPTAPGMPGSMPGAPTAPGMPGAMPGAPTTPGMPGAMPGADPSVMPGADTGAEMVASATPTGSPIEPGRIDPFAPIGVAKASKTKTFGNSVKARMRNEGVDFRLPSLLEAISFTDYNSDTKIGYIKTAADYKREKDALEAKQKAEEKEIVDQYKKVIYAKPSNVRLSSIFKGPKTTLASFEIVLGSRSDFQSIKTGEKITYGYNSEGKPIQAELKSLTDKSAVLKPIGVDDIEWKFNISDGSTRNTGNMNNPMMPGSMQGNMPGGFGNMPAGMPGGFGNMQNPNMGMPNMNQFGNGMNNIF